MTGFGRAEAGWEGGSLGVEVKSVNSRHLDLRVRLPREFAALEAALREAAAPFFQRGQVEVALRIPGEGLAPPEVEIDVDAAAQYARAAEQLAESGAGSGAIPVHVLLSLPGVARLREAQLDPEGARAALVSAVEEACEAARDMRAREGRALAEELEQRLAGAESQVGEIEARAGEIRAGLRERLEKRLSQLAPELELAPGRVEQEVVIYADRMDVTEETVRLRSHIAQFRETLAESGSIGRKLEFLLQEMGREVNTIGSKAADVPVTRHVVELKTEFEKLREQTLNVE